MKRILFISFVLAAFGMNANTYDSSSIDNESTQSYIKIRIKNDCNHDVKYKYNGTSNSLSKNYYRDLTIKPGHMLIVDGNDFMEITQSSDKKTFVICR